MKGGCRPCDQPHFFLGDTPTTKIDHGLLVADYPIKDWNTGKPKPLVAKAGEQYVVTGMFAINSIGGFAASDGLIIHKKFQDSTGKVLAEGNAVLPPDAQDIKLEGKPVEASAASASTPKKAARSLALFVTAVVDPRLAVRPPHRSAVKPPPGGFSRSRRSVAHVARSSLNVVSASRRATQSFGRA